jgi:hypothetical protein
MVKSSDNEDRDKKENCSFVLIHHAPKRQMLRPKWPQRFQSPGPLNSGSDGTRGGPLTYALCVIRIPDHICSSSTESPINTPVERLVPGWPSGLSSGTFPRGSTTRRSSAATTAAAAISPKADVTLQITHGIHDILRHFCPSFLLRIGSANLSALVFAGFSCPAAQSDEERLLLSSSTTAGKTH